MNGSARTRILVIDDNPEVRLLMTLALTAADMDVVGDAADGYPGIAGCGARTSARLINTHGPIEDFPEDVLREKRELALLFKDLATLRTNAPLFDDVEELRWRGPTEEFESVAKKIGDQRLLKRVRALEARMQSET